MAAAALMAWVNRSFWADAYFGEREPVDLTIEAIDVSFRAQTSGPSPYRLQEVPNTRHEVLPVVAPKPESSKVTVHGGTSELTGFITGPEGPLQGAEVVVQRFTKDGAAVVRTQTNSSGLWRITEILGGRYRVRAYVPSRFGSSGSEVFFLNEGETRSHNVNLSDPSDEPVVSGLVDGKGFVGSGAQAMVFVAIREVDEDGKTRQVAAQGFEVELVLDGVSAVMTSGPTARTGPGGLARFTYDCIEIWNGSATAVVLGRSYQVAVTPCEIAGEEPNDE